MSATITARKVLHEGWLTVTRLAIRLADGTEIKREIESHGTAAAVLPYDPERRLATLVQLLRAPVLLSGAASDILEAPAGIMDEDDAEETARREVQEETGLRLETLEHVATVWAMPGVSTETIALFLAPYDQDSKTGQGGGLAEEHENITVVEMPLARLWAMAERGELVDMKTLALVHALRVRHPELFG